MINSLTYIRLVIVLYSLLTFFSLSFMVRYFFSGVPGTFLKLKIVRMFANIVVLSTPLICLLTGVLGLYYYIFKHSPSRATSLGEQIFSLLIYLFIVLLMLSHNILLEVAHRSKMWRGLSA